MGGYVQRNKKGQRNVSLFNQLDSGYLKRIDKSIAVRCLVRAPTEI